MSFSQRLAIMTLIHKNSGSIQRNACVACETQLWECDKRTDRQTDRQTDGRTDRQTTDKVIPMCRYASQATQKGRQKTIEKLHANKSHEYRL